MKINVLFSLRPVIQLIYKPSTWREINNKFRISGWARAIQRPRHLIQDGRHFVKQKKKKIKIKSGRQAVHISLTIRGLVTQKKKKTGMSVALSSLIYGVRRRRSLGNIHMYTFSQHRIN